MSAPMVGRLQKKQKLVNFMDMSVSTPAARGTTDSSRCGQLPLPLLNSCMSDLKSARSCYLSSPNTQVIPPSDDRSGEEGGGGGAATSDGPTLIQVAVRLDDLKIKSPSAAMLLLRSRCDSNGTQITVTPGTCIDKTIVWHACTAVPRSANFRSDHVEHQSLRWDLAADE